MLPKFVILASLILSILSCTRLNEAALQDLEFIMIDAYPHCERSVTEQTEKFTQFSEDLYSLDSIAYFERIIQLEEMRLMVVETLDRSIEKIQKYSVGKPNSIIIDATSVYLRELQVFEDELGLILQDDLGQSLSQLDRYEFYTSITNLYDDHKLEEKGDVFVEKQKLFLEKHNISQKDIDKISSSN